jgi:hypothetical protein
VIERNRHRAEVRGLLAEFPVVAPIEARQIGKATLARHIAADWRGERHHFDLEDPRATPEALHGHPKSGASWEGFALHPVVRRLGVDWSACHYWKLHTGAELDLPVQDGGRRLGFEFKCGDAPDAIDGIGDGTSPPRGATSCMQAASDSRSAATSRHCLWLRQHA